MLLKKLLTHNVPEITVNSLSKIKDSVLLLDAREPEEFAVSHLNNAKFVGYKNFSLDSITNIDKHSEIVVYCAVGYRSEKITQKLIAAGFTHVKNLYGGIFEWKNKKLDVFDANGVTNNVHPYSKTWGLWLKNADKVYKKP
ncbi:MAG: rhodanese-like domain-containing protein [Ferruginibacter sp.]